MTAVDIVIKEVKTGAYITLPVLPETIPYTLGDVQADTVNIIGIGDIDYLRGRALDSFTIASFFPARYDAGYCRLTAIKKPLVYRELFKKWKDNNSALQIIVAAAGINTLMTIRSFLPELEGPEGDIKYSVTFKQHRTVYPRKIALGATTAPAKTETPKDRTPVATKKVTSYTVKKGDCLIKIAKALGIKDWRKELYEPNKKIIGSDPNAIKPGQVYKIT